LLSILELFLYSKFNIPTLFLVEKKKYFEKNKIEGNASNITKTLFSQNITFNKYNFSFVSNDEKDKKILQELIKEDIEWFYLKNGDSDGKGLLPKINSKNSIIRISNENEKYEINLIQSKEKVIFNHSLNTFSYSNPFEHPKNNITDFKFFNEFIQLQSLLAQFLIKKRGNSYLNKELIIQFGQNSYPQHNNIPKVYLLSLSLAISLQFTLTSYFFCMRMIEEKEKKLTELLERQGISKKDYFFSWLFTYLFIVIIPIIIYIYYFIQ